MDVAIAALTASWDLLREAAPWMLLGLAAAGLAKAFLPEGLIARALGKKGPAGVLRAALVGAPLPLCSCAVVPAAAELRRQGAGKGAVAAFLVSTPETGLDSMAASYALLGPFMTVARPLAALLTALCAGLLVDALDRSEPGGAAAPNPAPLSPGGG